MTDHTIQMMEKENPPRIKEAYSTLTIKIRPNNPNVQVSEQVKRGATLKLPKPLVEKIEGPFDDEDNLVEELVVDKTYVYKATKFKDSMFTPIKHIWFAEQLDDGEIVDLEYKKDDNPYLDDKGNVCFKYTVKECKKVRIYAYVAKPIKPVSIETPVISFPFPVDFFRMPGLNNDGNDIAPDLTYGKGVNTVKKVYPDNVVESLTKDYINKTVSMDLLSNKKDGYNKAIYSKEEIYKIDFAEDQVPWYVKPHAALADELMHGLSAIFDVPKGISAGEEIEYLDTHYTDNELFEKFEKGVSFLMSKGKLEENIKDMISMFKQNTGGVYHSNILTEAVKNHKDTKKYCKEVEDYIAEKLKINNGKFSKLVDEEIYIVKNKSLEERRKKGKTTTHIDKNGNEIFFMRPRFNSMADLINGERIALNDIWATYVELTDVEIKGDNYTVKYDVTLWDHFGLDKPDLEKYFNILKDARVIFSSWFTLQHLRGYKPFITQIKFSKEFTGNLNEGKYERNK